MSRLGANRRAHLDHSLKSTREERLEKDRYQDIAENTWQRAGDLADASPQSPFYAALEAAAKELVRDASLSSVEIKMQQGEIEDELFATGEEAEDWDPNHQ